MKNGTMRHPSGASAALLAAVPKVAVIGRAGAIATFNLHDYSAVPKSFNIEVIRPSTVFRRVRNK
jgi:hypothetical protein